MNFSVSTTSSAKLAAIMGPAIMAGLADLTSQPRYTILGIPPLFIAGFALTWFLPAGDPERVSLSTDTMQ